MNKKGDFSEILLPEQEQRNRRSQHENLTSDFVLPDEPTYEGKTAREWVEDFFLDGGAAGLCAMEGVVPALTMG